MCRSCFLIELNFLNNNMFGTGVSYTIVVSAYSIAMEGPVSLTVAAPISNFRLNQVKDCVHCTNFFVFIFVIVDRRGREWFNLC